MSFLNERRAENLDRLEKLRAKLGLSSRTLSEKACIYATGSFGRLEAGNNSDLDLFILTKTVDVKTEGSVEKKNLLSQLDTIIVKADLITAVRELGMPDFDADGRYLASHSTYDLIQSLGAHDDDYKNTLTGRLLLFLESQPLLGEEIYDQVIGEVIAVYFGDYATHPDDFVPAFLANDILRLWRTFCVNYEFGRKGKKLDGKIKNYKLKHSRMLTCYSALLFLLGKYSIAKTVSVSDAKEMVRLTPTQRLEWILGRGELSSSHTTVENLLGKYSEFLRKTDSPKEELISQFEEKSREWVRGTYEFGDLMAQALSFVGGDSRFHRIIMV